MARFLLVEGLNGQVRSKHIVRENTLAMGQQSPTCLSYLPLSVSDHSLMCFAYLLRIELHM